MQPHRIQRTRRHKLPPNTVCVTRPGIYGNPFRVGIEAKDSAEAVRMFRDYLFGNPALVAAAIPLLRGRNLACWCKPGEPCHADVWLEVVNK